MNGEQRTMPDVEWHFSKHHDILSYLAINGFDIFSGHSAMQMPLIGVAPCNQGPMRVEAYIH